MNSQIYDDAFFTEESKVSLRCAQQIVPLIYDLFEPSSIIDVGCGVGAFLHSFRKLGVQELLGLDGDYVPRDRLVVPADEFRATDLSKPFSAERRFDMVLSLEVGEHLDPPVADGFVHSLCQLGDVIVFSAAIPLQMGDHHVNEQWQSYWVAKFMQNGFQPFDVVRPKIWANQNIEVYYKQNIIVFANGAGIRRYSSLLKPESAAKDPKCYDLVHPDMFAMRVGTVQYLSNFILQIANADRPFRIRRTADGGLVADPV